MKVKYSKPKGQRVLKSTKIIIRVGQYKGCKQLVPFGIKGNGPNYTLELWEGRCYMNGKWYKFDAPSYSSVYSLRACKRFIHKINVPKGFQFLILHPYINHYFIITK